MDNRHDNVIVYEMKRHVPFTAFGAGTGIVLLLAVVLLSIPASITGPLFYISHPVHVVLSALVTTSMYRRYRLSIVGAVVIGYVGSIATASISDVIFPYLGGELVGAKMEFELPFIHEWWLVNPAAAAGIGIGLWRPFTRVSHAGHVMISTWASLFFLVSHGQANWLPLLPVIFALLFVSVWFPCCFSDIIFPLLFVTKGRGNERGSGQQADAAH